MGVKAGVLFSALVAAAASGCYVETIDDRAPATGKREGNGNDVDPNETGVCRLNIAKGCFDGHVLSKKEFFVEGKQFFNADDFAARFGELLTLNAPNAELRAEDVELKLTTAVDNQSFVQGFEYYFTGERTGSGKVRTNGNFSLNELPEGVYDLRVQRSVKFELSHKVAKAAKVEPQKPDAVPVDPNAPAPTQPVPQQPAEPELETVTRTFCATIYADRTLDVRRAKREADIFGDFRLHITDANCEGAQSGTTLTLVP